MTALEKLRKEHPNWKKQELAKCVDCDCPGDWGYAEHPALQWCESHTCEECWNREIPGTEEKEKDMTGSKETQCTNCMHREVCIYKMDFLAAQKAVDFLEYEHAKGGTVRLCDIPFIYPIELKCKHFYQATVVRG